MQWYRAYTGMSADPKFKVIATMAQTERVVALAVWVAMLEHACTHEGSIHDLNPLDIGCALDVPADVVQRVMMAYSEKGMISGSHITAWKRRQYVSDNVTKRVQEHRKRRRNVSETHQNRTEQIRTESETRAPAAAPTKGTRFPHETMPEPWKQFCQQERPDLDPSATFDRCRDYWISAPGQRGVKRDWDATWRNWVRNERKPVTITATTVISGAPPPGFREAKTTGEYIEYLRHKHNDPKLTFGDYRVSKYQYVPVEWNVSDSIKVTP